MAIKKILINIEDTERSAEFYTRFLRARGFTVDSVDALVRPLKEAGVRFHLDPLDAEGEVRIAFFYDLDGILLEFVEGPLRYHVVYDEAGERADWGLGAHASGHELRADADGFVFAVEGHA